MLFYCCFIDITLGHVEPAGLSRATDRLDIDHIRLMTQSFSAVKRHDITSSRRACRRSSHSFYCRQCTHTTCCNHLGDGSAALPLKIACSPNWRQNPKRIYIPDAFRLNFGFLKLDEITGCGFSSTSCRGSPSPNPDVLFLDAMGVFRRNWQIKI